VGKEEDPLARDNSERVLVKEITMNKVHDTKDSRAVIYVRVSTTAQADEGNSLTTQERVCREYAARKEYKVLQVFVDAGESAKTANRTEFQKMLKLCAIKKNGINAVIVYKVDRFARSVEDHATVRALLKRYKVELLSATE
jgi:site-specific DNA recombinase